ncbi:AAA family ATPase [Candidatus Stoquefichus massiliensis]|uniref:AAA family ATPase n=1 Tax=Candidatus Stoquefichus massiliensis TaxID=1470350 RepID=UPI0004865C39|nr:AAA family ATPase [Candidatus Stoquefichus massiliensis]
MDDLFIKQVSVIKDLHNSTEYPFSIPIIQNFDPLCFERPVSFLIGENGVGKSTFIEALAVALGMNAEGGTENFQFQTMNTHSDLYQYMRISKGVRRPQTKFFLRAESFYNVASEIDEIGREDSRMYNAYGGKSLHQCSHGESFMQLMMNRFSGNGLYILDEPEAALSPSRQLSLLVLIDDLVKAGSQFIVSTHSPILLSYKDAMIYDLNHDFEKTAFKETDIYQLYKLVLDNPEGMQYHLFNEKK